MLLSGIYYGKTPIARAYKGKDIIWSLGTNKYLDDFSLDIKLNTAAYITRGAMEYIKLEKNITVSNIADIQYGDTGELCISAGIYSFIISPDVSLGDSSIISPDLPIQTQSGAIGDAADSALGFSDHRIYTGGNIDISKSPSILPTVNTSIKHGGDVSADMWPSRVSTCNEILQTLMDTVVHTAKSSVGYIDDQINASTNADMRTTPAAVGVAEENIKISCDAYTNVLLTKKHLADNKVAIDISANEENSQSIVGIIDEYADIIIDAELVNPASSSGLIDEETEVNLDANLHDSASKNSVVDNEVCVDNDVSASVTKSEVAHMENDVLVLIDTSISANKAESTKSDTKIESRMDSAASVNKSNAAEVSSEIVADEYASIGVANAESGYIVTDLSVANNVVESVTPSEAGEMNHVTRVHQNASMHDAESKSHYFDNEVCVDVDATVNSSVSSSGRSEIVVLEDEQASLNCINAEAVNGHEDIVIVADTLFSGDQSSPLQSEMDTTVAFYVTEDVSQSQSVGTHEIVEASTDVDMGTSRTENGVALNHMIIYSHANEDVSKSSGAIVDETNSIDALVHYSSQPTAGGYANETILADATVMGSSSLSESANINKKIFTNESVDLFGALTTNAYVEDGDIVLGSHTEASVAVANVEQADIGLYTNNNTAVAYDDTVAHTAFEQTVITNVVNESSALSDGVFAESGVAVDNDILTSLSDSVHYLQGTDINQGGVFVWQISDSNASKLQSMLKEHCVAIIYNSDESRAYITELTHVNIDTALNSALSSAELIGETSELKVTAVVSNPTGERAIVDNHVFIDGESQVGLSDCITAKLDESLCVVENIKLNNSVSENLKINNEMLEFNFNNVFALTQETKTAFDISVSSSVDAGVDTSDSDIIKSYDCYLLFGADTDASMSDENHFRTGNACSFFGGYGSLVLGNESEFASDSVILSGGGVDIKCGNIYQLQSDKLIFMLQSDASICNGRPLKLRLYNLVLTHSDSNIRTMSPTAFRFNKCVRSDSSTVLITPEPTSSAVSTQIMSNCSNNIILLEPPCASVDGPIRSHQNASMANKDGAAFYTNDYIKINCNNAICVDVSKYIYWRTNIKNIYIANLRTDMDSRDVVSNNIVALLNDAIFNVNTSKTTGLLDVSAVITNEQTLSTSVYNHIAENRTLETNFSIRNCAILNFEDGMWGYPIWRNDDLLITQAYHTEELGDGIILY
jgi:hypothetical protein